MDSDFPPPRHSVGGFISGARNFYSKWQGILALLTLLGLLPALLLGVMTRSAGCLRNCIADTGSPQEDYLKQMDQARKQQFLGRLTYTDTRKAKLTVGEASTFAASLRGAWKVGKSNGNRVSKVTTGGQVGMKLHCSAAAICKPVSSPTQFVGPRGDASNWIWQVEAKKAEKVSMVLTVTSYFEGSKTVLRENAFASVARAEEKSKPGGVLGLLKGIYSEIRKFIDELAVVAGSLVGIVALVTAVKEVRKRNGAPETPETPPPTPRQSPATPISNPAAQGSSDHTPASTTGAPSDGPP